MARPQKIGLDYFPLDVDIDQDDKVAIIEAQHGVLGFTVIIKLLMKVYSEGYYYDWTEKEQILFSKRINVGINEVNVIINDWIKWGLFDEGLFKEHKILTSKGIQYRYFEAVKRRQRVEIVREFLLSDENIAKSYNNLVIVSINEDEEVIKKDNVDINQEGEGVNVDINPQSKVEESKVNESRVNKSSSNNNTIAVEIETDVPVALVDAASTKQDETVADIDADSMQQDITKRSEDLQRLENYYKCEIRKKNVCSGKDLQDMVHVYENYKDINFIMSVMENAKNDYINRYGKLEINSFSYFIPILEERWNLLHNGKKQNSITKNMTSKIPIKKTRFHTAESRSEKYSNDELEDIMARKRRKAIERMKGEKSIWY